MLPHPVLLRVFALCWLLAETEAHRCLKLSIPGGAEGWGGVENTETQPRSAKIRVARSKENATKSMLFNFFIPSSLLRRKGEEGIKKLKSILH